MTNTNASGIGIPLAAVKGHRLTRIKIEDSLHRWEHYERLVASEMPKRFTELAVRAALAKCAEMIDFYDRLLEDWE